MDECPNCGSMNRTPWDFTIINTSGVQNNRLSVNDLWVAAVQGCADCSETLVVTRADQHEWQQLTPTSS